MRQLERHLIGAACARLLNLYAAAQDAADAEAFAAIFAPDAVWERPGRPAVIGRNAILAHAKDVFRDDQHRGVLLHCITNVLVDVQSEKTATSRAYSIAYGGPKVVGADHAAMAPPIGVVIYENRYALVGDDWKVSFHKSIYQLK